MLLIKDLVRALYYFTHNLRVEVNELRLQESGQTHLATSYRVFYSQLGSKRAQCSDLLLNLLMVNMSIATGPVSYRVVLG